MKQYYHLSKTNMNGKTLTPRTPENYFTKNGFEDGKTARVCFTPSIQQSLMAMSMKHENVELYVHVPIGDFKIQKITTKMVPDSKITGEVWIKHDVKIECIGIIHVIGDANKPGIEFKYGNSVAELYEWDWKWKKKFNENISEQVSLYLSSWR